MLTAPQALVAYRVVCLQLNAQICLTVAFIVYALECILHHKLWWPRVVCLQQMHKSASLLLSVAQIH